MAEPAQHPPGPRGIGAALAVQADDLTTGAQTESAQQRREDLAFRQRVAATEGAIRPGLGASEIAVQVQVEGTRHMAGRVGPLAGLGVRQVEAAVKDQWVVHPTEVGRRNQGGECHANLSLSGRFGSGAAIAAEPALPGCWRCRVVGARNGSGVKPRRD